MKNKIWRLYSWHLLMLSLSHHIYCLYFYCYLLKLIMPEQKTLNQCLDPTFMIEDTPSCIHQVAQVPFEMVKQSSSLFNLLK